MRYNAPEISENLNTHLCVEEMRRHWTGALRRTNTVKVNGDFIVVRVEQDIRCPSVHYFRHERAREYRR